MNSRRSEFTVLVVEDELLLRMELADELQDAGWNTLEAASGEAALALLGNAPKIDLLITDIRLGGLADGWSVAEQFRQINPDGAVLYISANPDLVTRRVQGSMFLGKPVEMRKVLDICDRLMLRP